MASLMRGERSLSCSSLRNPPRRRARDGPPHPLSPQAGTRCPAAGPGRPPKNHTCAHPKGLTAPLPMAQPQRAQSPGNENICSAPECKARRQRALYVNRAPDPRWCRGRGHEKYRKGPALHPPHHTAATGTRWPGLGGCPVGGWRGPDEVTSVPPPLEAVPPPSCPPRPRERRGEPGSPLINQLFFSFRKF